MASGNGFKVIVTMIGLDGHNTGAEIVAMLLRDAGFEVIYLGNNQSPEMIVAAAIQEDVDVVGISSHAMNYDQLERVVELLREKGIHDVPVICGGNIPRARIRTLKENGVADVYPPGSSNEAIVSGITALAKARRAANAESV